MQRTGKKRIKDNRKRKKKADVAGRVNLTPEQKESLVSKVKSIALPLCSDEALVLAGVEYVKEGNNDILRIFIDKPGGVTLDDCSRISLELGDLLDVNLDIIAHYRLEVSSPGIKIT